MTNPFLNIHACFMLVYMEKPVRTNFRWWTFPATLASPVDTFQSASFSCGRLWLYQTMKAHYWNMNIMRSLESDLAERKSEQFIHQLYGSPPRKLLNPINSIQLFLKRKGRPGLVSRLGLPLLEERKKSSFEKWPLAIWSSSLMLQSISVSRMDRSFLNSLQRKRGFFMVLENGSINNFLTKNRNKLDNEIHYFYRTTV